MIDYSRAVCWTEGETHHVGRVAIVRYSPTMTGHVYDIRNRILIRHSHTGELEFVNREKLRNYPETEIPTP